MKENCDYYDISPTLQSSLGVFPGDKKFERQVILDFATGHNLVLSNIHTTLHIGAHADAPSHYQRGGAGMDLVGLAPYLGRCELVKAAVPFGTRLNRSHLPTKWEPQAPRVLFCTGTFPDPKNWNSDFASFDPGLIDELAAGGVQLIGLDTPSIDPESSKLLEAHERVAHHGLAILEGLVLEHVPAGLYELIALPLKIKDGDASPVRAILRVVNPSN